MSDGFKTSCPKCGCLRVVVVEAKVAGGTTIYPCSILTPDGFDVDPLGELELDDYSTEDEVVMCPKCQARFPLDTIQDGGDPVPDVPIDHLFVVIHEGYISYRHSCGAGSTPGNTAKDLAYILNLHPNSTYEVRDERMFHGKMYHT